MRVLRPTAITTVASRIGGIRPTSSVYSALRHPEMPLQRGGEVRGYGCLRLVGIARLAGGDDRHVLAERPEGDRRGQAAAETDQAEIVVHPPTARLDQRV